MSSPKKLLVYIDGTEESITAAQYAICLASFLQADLIALYVINTRAMEDLLKARIFLKDEQMEYEHDMQADAERYLSERAEALQAQGIEVETKLSYRDPAYAVADEQPGDFSRMVVMASRMRRGWRRAILGSGSDEVIRRSHGAVMVIPAGRARRGSRPPEDDADALPEPPASPNQRFTGAP